MIFPYCLFLSRRNLLWLERILGGEIETARIRAERASPSLLLRVDTDSSHFAVCLFVCLF